MNKDLRSVIESPMYYFAFMVTFLKSKVWSIYNKAMASLWGVKVGKKCRYKGKISFLREPGSTIKIGDNCSFYSSRLSNRVGLYCPCMLSTVTCEAEIIIGNNCGFSGTRIWSATRVILGNNVRCGANTYITDSDAHTDDPRAGKDAPVIIEDNVWLGMDVKVLKGVRIGKNSMIAAGSIVTRNVPENVIAGGIPCKVIKKIES